MRHLLPKEKKGVCPKFLSPLSANYSIWEIICGCWGIYVLYNCGGVYVTLYTAKMHVLFTRFLLLDHEDASEGWSLSFDTTSRFIRNLQVIQDSRKRLGGQGFSLIFDTNSRFIRNLHVLQDSMKLLGGHEEYGCVSKVGSRWKFLKNSSLSISGTCMSLKTPWRDIVSQK